MLSLAERLLLLALHDKKGTVACSSSTAIPYGQAGAVLQDLALQGRIAYRDGKVAVVDMKATGDDVFDEALAIIARSGKPRDTKYWVTKLKASVKNLRRRLQGRLVEKGILRRERRRLLWVFPADRYPTRDPRPESELRDQIRSVVLGGGARDPQTVSLVGLIGVCNLSDNVFAKEERRSAKKAIKQLTAADEVAKSVARAIADAAAAAAAVTAVAIVGSSPSH